MAVVSVGSGYFVGFRPICSYDSKWLICISNTVVKVYSLKSGECVHNLRGHTKAVTGVQAHPNNKLQILSCSLDETVIQWDYSDGILLKKYKLNGPIHAMLPFPSCETKNMHLLMKNQTTAFDLISYEIGPTLDKGGEVLLTNCSNDERCVALGYKGQFVASVNNTDLIIKDLRSKRKIKHRGHTNLSYFTCVACHPKEECLATGCSDGRIIIWKHFLGSPKVVKTINHWHALPVMDLRFSVEGTRLFSGGHECTLVTWQLSQHTRDFLPRLGAPIKNISISPDNQLIIASLSDNEILVIDGSSRNIIQAIMGITVRQLGYQRANPFPMGLRYDPNNRALITNGKPGHLQFYCLHTNKPLFNLDVVGMNYTSPENLDKQSGITEVIRADLNEDGKWLATLQYWETSEFDPEIKLKFWFYNSTEQKYVLNTIIEMPHTKMVNCLRFCPLVKTGQSNSNIMQLAVTCSNDGKFRLWSLLDDTNLYRTNTKWNCELEGFYRNYIPREATFAEDGSLLGVIFDHLVTLWEPMTNTLKRVMEHPLDHSKCRQLLFGRKSCAHLLVSASESRMTVWSILTCTIVWSVEITVSCLMPDPLTELMAAFTEDKCLFVFRPDESSPVYQKKGVSEEGVVYAAFIPNPSDITDLPPQLQWQEKSQLYFMNNTQELLTIVEKQDEPTGLKRPSSMTIPENLPENAFSLIVGKRRKVENEPEAMDTTDASLPKYSSPLLRELIHTPTAVCAPVVSFAGRFLHSLLTPRHTSTAS